MPPTLDRSHPPLPLPAGGYTIDYMDTNGRRPGESGFIPPLRGVEDPESRATKAAGLPGGYDEDFRDSNGLAPHEEGFQPPVYGPDYEDAEGRHPGDEGFISPSWRRKQAPLGYGDYDGGYRDSAGRSPGEAGFLPPLVERALAEGLTQTNLMRPLASVH